ncbi:MAG: 16S rRNA (guanine(527)-N(7))-methyltransferase RsmG [Oscillospiraceae bacterium]|nr:16S rRNA (guanine(527)-N(7))-methyltransferase RsmG [Oscillospiraceae bacterium]
MTIIEMFADAGLTINKTQEKQFQTLFEFMVEYNKNVNLTSITEFEDVIIKHFIDSVLPFSMLDISGNESFIDVGTGAGYPGLPLLICYPGLRGTLCDSLGKRCTYLELACGKIGVKAEIVHARSEELGRMRREQYDIATARAVAAMPVLTEFCLPFVRMGGRFIALKSVSENIGAASGAVKTLGGELEKTEDYKLPNGDGRRLIVVKKISQTPTKYPRSYANITKKPL